MGLLKKFFNQTRKPEGFLGRMMIRGMNSGHAQMAEWGLSHLPASDFAEILEIGCGGGKNADELLKKYPASKVTAIDFSSVAVEKATEYNRESIANGRCVVQHGDVSSLDFPQESFDLATAFETIYFWPGLEKCFGEVFSVLKKDGLFMIVNESDGTDAMSRKFEKIVDGMRCYTVEEIEAALRKAGFSEIKADHHPSKPWITVLAKK